MFKLPQEQIKEIENRLQKYDAHQAAYRDPNTSGIEKRIAFDSAHSIRIDAIDDVRKLLSHIRAMERGE